MATTIKRTTIHHAPARRTDAPPPLPQAPLQGRAPEIEQPIYTESENGAEPEAADETRVVTVGEEQLARSQEIEQMGVEQWKAAHDERDPDQQPQSVAGVGPTET